MAKLKESRGLYAVGVRKGRGSGEIDAVLGKRGPLPLRVDMKGSCAFSSAATDWSAQESAEVGFTHSYLYTQLLAASL